MQGCPSNTTHRVSGHAGPDRAAHLESQGSPPKIPRIRSLPERLTREAGVDVSEAQPCELWGLVHADVGAAAVVGQHEGHHCTDWILDDAAQPATDRGIFQVCSMHMVCGSRSA